MEPEIEFSATDAQLSDLIKPIVAALVATQSTFRGTPDDAAHIAQAIINACK